MLLSAGLIHRVLSARNLLCNSFAGLSLGWWFTAGQRLNKNDDVRFFVDPRLDHQGDWWKPEAKGGASLSEYAGVCQTHMGIHRTYVDEMTALWAEAKDTPGPSGADGTEALPVYASVGECTLIPTGVGMDSLKAHGTTEPCDSFRGTKRVHCGREGC